MHISAGVLVLTVLFYNKPVDTSYVKETSHIIATFEIQSL